MTATTLRIALGIDMLTTSIVLGATVWFFLIQSPALMKSLGRERFVPLQMRLAALFFTSVTALLVVMLAATVLRAGPVVAWPTITAAVALAAVAINKLVILPRALRAGGKSIRQDDHQAPANEADFVSEGAGSSTKTLHRLVVLFVVTMLAGLVAHGLDFITTTPLS